MKFWIGILRVQKRNKAIGIGVEAYRFKDLLSLDFLSNESSRFRRWCLLLGLLLTRGSFFLSWNFLRVRLEKTEKRIVLELSLVINLISTDRNNN